MRTVINTKTVMTQITDGGTAAQPVPSEQQNAPALTEPQALQLVDLAITGRGSLQGPGGHRVVPQR